MWRLPTLVDAEPVIEAFIAEAERKEHEARIGPHYRNEDGTYDEAAIVSQGNWYRRMAIRVGAGYTNPSRDWRSEAMATC
jgi:hypothetical protein